MLLIIDFWASVLNLSWPIAGFLFFAFLSLVTDNETFLFMTTLLVNQTFISELQFSFTTVLNIYLACCYKVKWVVSQADWFSNLVKSRFTFVCTVLEDLTYTNISCWTEQIFPKNPYVMNQINPLTLILLS